MKSKSFSKRLRFAWNGIRSAWKDERSFRAQIACAMGAIAILLLLRPGPVWWAIFLFIIGGVLAAELFNTALERIVDHLHQENHPMIGLAKDCAAGSVLILSLVALGILAALLVDTFLM